ncbi:MAG: MBL fold metallo-hydrolase [Deltaproteobacteria bacterium]|nr:MBL fold metallo-hydrolase [Deltaproteobacteria bacterium]
MKFSVLASGSKGNACYVETEDARVLVDAGLSAREIERRLKLVGVDPNGIDGLFITHEHADHIRGAGPFARRFDVPVFINKPTYDRSKKFLGSLSTPIIVATGMPVTLKNLVIETFTKCHDAVDPVGLVFSCNGSRIGLATDLGRTTNLVEDRLRDCNALILEFNHDITMLEQGPYPLALKRRIKGPDGHLSNDQAETLLKKLLHADLRHVVLAHLSDANNRPDHALRAASRALDTRRNITASVWVSRQDEPGPLISV